MKSPLILFVALLLLVGCSSAVPAVQSQSSAATAATSVQPQPTVAAAVVPSSIPSTPQPTVASAVVPTASSAPSPVATQPSAAAPTTVVVSDGTPVHQIPPAEAEAIIADTARQTILALKERDMQQLARLVHPQQGVVFSPYGFVGEERLSFKAEQLPGALNDPTIYTWGSYDGSGEPIDLSFDAYFKRFVYSQDFAQAPQIAYNRIIREGYHADQFDPNSIMVEYHFPGFDPRFEGMDWESLRLVFQQAEQRWYLVGIIHNQWTI
jgi:hypothetical protein